MRLTAEEHTILREATIDFAAYARVLALMKRAAQPVTVQPPPPLSEPEPTLGISNLETSLLDVLDLIPISIFIKDRAGRYVFANQHTCDLLQLPRAEVIGMTAFDFRSPAVAQRLFDTEQEMMARGERIEEEELCWQAPDGSTHYYLASKVSLRNGDGEVIGLLGTSRDITERKLAAEADETEHRLLRTVIDQLDDAILVKDREGQCVLANDSAMRSFGIPLDVSDCVELTDSLPIEEVVAARAEEQTVMASGVPILEREVYIPPEQGVHGDRYYTQTKVPLRDERGAVTGLLSIRRNISQRKVAQQTQLQLALERERSTILNDFITNASHEFRTPISVIDTSLYLMERTPDPTRRAQFRMRIAEQSARINQLVDALILMLKLDRKPQMEPHAIDLNGVLQMSADKLAARAAEEVLTLVVEQAPATELIYGDEPMLATALMALLDNAMRHTAKGGTITLRHSISEREHVLSIEDTGVGMSEAVCQQIFQRFYRADTSHSTSGFGLGLAITKRIVELHAGRISVSSTPGVGSRFDIQLPRLPRV